MERSCRLETERRLVQLASEYGKSLISPQTGYLHYFGPQAETHTAIPFLENLYLALIWMKTRTAEYIQQGSELLSRILEFRSDRNFPCYLHEYPVCKDSLLWAKSLLPLTLISRHFGHVLGSETRIKLQQTISILLQNSGELPLFLKARVDCAKNVLDSSSPVSEDLFCNSWKKQPLEQCAEIAAAFYSINAALPDALFDRLRSQWDPARHAVCSNDAKQTGYFPQITSYDILMYYLQGAIPARSDLTCSHALLFAALLPMECADPIIENITTPFTCSVRSKLEPFPPHEDTFQNIFYALWGKASHPATFVCQVAPQVLCEAQKYHDGADLLFSFREDFSGSDDDNAKEISFFFNLLKDQKFTFFSPEGVANVFHENRPLTLEIEGMKFVLQFEIYEGEGQFAGHIFPGNRPAQICTKGQHRYALFDRQILLRTVARNLDTKIKVSVRLAKND